MRIQPVQGCHPDNARASEEDGRRVSAPSAVGTTDPAFNEAFHPEAPFCQPFCLGATFMGPGLTLTCRFCGRTWV